MAKHRRWPKAQVLQKVPSAILLLDSNLPDVLDLFPMLSWIDAFLVSEMPTEMAQHRISINGSVKQLG
jgi:hypothetical protein